MPADLSQKKVILLVNLGTPASPSVSDVRRYLKEFLSDPHVIDVPALLRWAIVNLFVLPFRPKQSAEAYRSIWTEQGSPLLWHTEALAEQLQQYLGENYVVRVAMRYGQPALRVCLNQLISEGAKKITLLPLFPQYATATTGSIKQVVFDCFASNKLSPELTFIDSFYDDPGFIQSWVQQIQVGNGLAADEHLLLSYHGLPWRQIHKAEKEVSEACQQGHPCPSISSANAGCYRAQCYATSRAIVAELRLTDEAYTVAFQSRLGRTPWITPYTDELLPKLIERGVKKLVIASPSFAVDCLETLEELGIRAEEQWGELGGESFRLIPCLNSSSTWVRSLAGLLQR